MVDETQPAARMFEEDVQSLLERLAPSMVEHILGLERLIYGQCNGVVGIRNSGGDRLLVARIPVIDSIVVVLVVIIIVNVVVFVNVVIVQNNVIVFVVAAVFMRGGGGGSSNSPTTDTAPTNNAAITFKWTNEWEW